MHEERGGKIHLKGNMLIILQKPVGISHEWVLNFFKYQEPEFYARLFNNYEEGPFEVPPGSMKFCVIF